MKPCGKINRVDLDELANRKTNLCDKFVNYVQLTNHLKECKACRDYVMLLSKEGNELNQTVEDNLQFIRQIMNLGVTYDKIMDDLNLYYCYHPNEDLHELIRLTRSLKYEYNREERNNTYNYLEASKLAPIIHNSPYNKPPIFKLVIRSIRNIFSIQ